MNHFFDIPFFKKAFGIDSSVELDELNWELVRYIGEMTDFNNMETYEETYPSGPTSDPPGPISGTNRVLRGGSWESPSKQCRSANRGQKDPTNYSLDIGFRLVKEP